MTATKKEVSIAGGKRLDQLKIIIEAEIINADDLAYSATEKYMAVGLHLLEARSLFPGDLEFGKWRAKALPNIKTNWAGRLMQIASDDRIMGPDQKLLPGAVAMGVSVLAELASASDEVVESVMDSEKSPTVAEVRKAKKAAKEATSTKPPEATVAAPKIPEPAIGRNREENKGKKQPSLEQRAQEAIDLPFLERLMNYRPDLDAIIPSDPFIVFGMGSNFTDVAPNTEDLQAWHGILETAYESKMNEGDKLKLGECLDAALVLCKGIKEGQK